MQCACGVFSSLYCPALQYFYHIVSKTTRFKKKIIKHKICVLFSSVTCVWNIYRSNKKSNVKKKMYVVLHVKCPLLWSDINENWILSTIFRNIFKYKISWKSFQWEPNCSIADTETGTDMRKLIAAFRNFANAPKYEFNCPAIYVTL